MTIDIQWDKKFEVSHPKIDMEHRLFMDLIRTLSQADESLDNKAWNVRLLREIKKFADFHFFSEENLMLQTGFPEFTEHHQKHCDLLLMLDERVQAYTSGLIELEAIVVFLFDWFLMHTSQADKKLAKHLALFSEAETT